MYRRRCEWSGCTTTLPSSLTPLSESLLSLLVREAKVSSSKGKCKKFEESTALPTNSSRIPPTMLSVVVVICSSIAFSSSSRSALRSSVGVEGALLVTEGGHGSGLQLGSWRNSDSEETRANGLTTDPEKEGNVGAVDSTEGERIVPAPTLVLNDLF